ncbi:MAG: hypothetical protein J5755_06070 [Clostridia bacterium]|nr:hypothetical protein [Clostridia bacterium]
MRLTKSDFMRGIQCGKMLWLDRHKPEYKVVSPAVRARLDAGNEFGDKAMGMFGDYVEMTAYTPDGRIDCAAMVQNTRNHIALGTPVICEGAFTSEGLYCAVDILVRDEHAAEPTYAMYEVKDAGEVQPQFILDAAFQYYVASRTVRITQIYIVTHGPDDSFVTHDVTRLAGITQMALPAYVGEVQAAAAQANEPTIPCGEQCECPYRCWYWDYCHKNK